VDFLLDRSRPDPSVCLCADWISDVMRCDRQHIRMQSGRRLGASLHHQRTRLWRTSLLARRNGLVHACYYSRRAIRIRGLADRSHPASSELAKAARGRSSSSNSTATRDGMSATMVVDGRSRLSRVFGTVRIHASQLLTLLVLGCIPLGAQQIQATAAKPAFVFEGVYLR
jgi:hypothetical protein